MPESESSARLEVEVWKLEFDRDQQKKVGQGFEREGSFRSRSPERRRKIHKPRKEQKMTTQELTTKAYEEKVNAQLQQTKAQLDEFEARAKGKMAQAEINTINHLKAKHLAIERKRQDLKTIGDAKFEQFKSEMDADLAKLKTSLAELATKLKA